MKLTKEACESAIENFSTGMAALTEAFDVLTPVCTRIEIRSFVVLLKKMESVRFDVENIIERHADSFPCPPFYSVLTQKINEKMKPINQKFLKETVQ